MESGVPDSIARFVADLTVASIGTTVNPYRVHEPTLDRPGGAGQRAANLETYLGARQHPALMLVGEAPGYQGCRFSGIAFTSERSLPAEQRSSTRPEGWAEPSATIIHGALAQAGLELDTVLWNACPLHPAGLNPLSNRTPTRSELEAGLEWLTRLIALLRPGLVVAVGRSAQRSLPDAPVIRHPANGGASACRAGIAAIAAQIRD
jgi:uracil-DNA glycosylase